MIFQVSHGLVHIKLTYCPKNEVKRGHRVHFCLKGFNHPELTEGDIKFLNNTEFFVEKITNKIIETKDVQMDFAVADLMVFGEIHPDIPIRHVETIEKLHSSVNEIDQWALIG